jgi:hypothetical protein
MVNLISRTQKLYDDISEYELRSRNSRIVRCGIQNEYRTLKERLRETAHYVGLRKNECRENQLYHNFFVPSIQEAAAFGFFKRIGTDVRKLASSVGEAHYKLNKYKPFSEWFKLANSQGGYTNISIVEFPHQKEDTIREDWKTIRKEFGSQDSFYFYPSNEMWHLYYKNCTEDAGTNAVKRLEQLGFKVEL